ncbi:DUF1672 family protein, partial [Metabacillus malikii]
TYKTEVKVHNVVGSQDAATVFVESVGEPHFYTYAVVPIDIQKKEVKLDNVFTQEGQVEHAIMSGLYHQIYINEFDRLDSYFIDLESKGEVVGKTKESLENVGGIGYMTPYYYITVSSYDVALKKMYQSYIDNPNISVAELRNTFEENEFSTKYLKITIHLFMRDKYKQPSTELLSEVAQDIESLDSIPKGSYSVYLHDNFIDKITDTATKENTIKRAHPNYIIRE